MEPDGTVIDAQTGETCGMVDLSGDPREKSQNLADCSDCSHVMVILCYIMLYFVLCCLYMLIYVLCV